MGQQDDRTAGQRDGRTIGPQDGRAVGRQDDRTIELLRTVGSQQQHHRAAAGFSQARRKGAPSLGPIRKGPIPRAPPFAPAGTPHNVGAGVSDGYAACTVEPTAATEPPCRSSLPENSPARERAMRESVGHPIPPSKEVGQKNEHSRIISPLPLSWSSTAHSVYEAENPRSSA